MPKNCPLVYIILLTWNGRKHTLECIRSICQNDYPNYRILLVDNASTDDTVGVVATEFPQIEVIKNPSNLGYAEGNNVGIQYAMERGAEFFLILNNDTVIDRSAITILVNAASQAEGAFISSPAIYKYSSPDEPAFWGNFWDSATFRFRPAERFQASSSLGTAEMIPTGSVPGCSLFFGPDVVRKVGLFDSRFFLTWEDTDWCSRAVREGCRIFIVPTAKVWHKESQSFADGSPKAAYDYYYFRNRFLWIEKNLPGSNRWRATFRCWRELVKPVLPRYGPASKNVRLLVFRARLLGAWHYFTRRFGPL